MPAAAFEGASISLARAGMVRWARAAALQMPTGAHQTQGVLERSGAQRTRRQVLSWPQQYQ